MKERISKYLEYRGISRYKFYKTTGLSNGYLDKGGDVSLQNYEKIGYYYPELNMSWVSTGEGSMLNPSDGDTSSPSDRAGVPMIGGQVVAYDAESYAEALSKYGDDLVPEYNAEFRGGRSGATLDQADIIAHWTIPNAPKGSFIITMRGNSMSPEIASGARLLLAPMNFDKSNPCSIPFGRVFGIVVASEDSTEPPMAYIKILRRHTDKSLERRFWIARSVNTQLFDDFDIPVERVTHLYKLLYAINPMWGL